MVIKIWRCTNSSNNYFQRNNCLLRMLENNQLDSIHVASCTVHSLEVWYNFCPRLPNRKLSYSYLTKCIPRLGINVAECFSCLRKRISRSKCFSFFNTKKTNIIGNARFKEFHSKNSIFSMSLLVENFFLTICYTAVMSYKLAINAVTAFNADIFGLISAANGIFLSHAERKDGIGKI